MKHYDPKNIVIILANVTIGGGFAEDSMVKVTWDSPKYEDVVGVDGKVTRTRIHDGRATVTVALMQSSDENTTFSTMLNNDLASRNGAGVGGFSLSDLNGDTALSSIEAWIKNMPESEWAKKVGARLWEIRCSSLVGVVGGSLEV